MLASGLSRLLPLLALTIVVGAASCKKSNSAEDAAEPPPRPAEDAAPTGVGEPKSEVGTTWYRGALYSGELRMPFFLEVPNSDGPAAVMTSGKRSLATTSWTDDQVEIEFELYQSRISARRVGNKLEGHWRMDAKAFGKTKLPFQAVAIASPDSTRRFDPEPGYQPEPSPLEGESRWRLEFQESGSAELALRPARATLHATLSFPTGNIVVLEGNVYENLIYLSEFDGSSPYLLEAKYDQAKGLLTGQWTAGPTLAWHEAFSGRRIKKPSTRAAAVGFSKGQGLMIPARERPLPLPAGKPVIVELGGAWCPACAYSAVHLRKIYREHHDKHGLEILSLVYEFTEDADFNQRRAKLFKKRHNLPWTVMPVHGSTEQASEIMPTALSDVDVSSFPLAIFLDREHKIVDVVAGFAPEQAEAEHDRVVAEYNAALEKILAP